MPLFLLAAAVGIAAIAVILLIWRYVDRHVKEAYSDVSPEALEQKLEEALEQQALLKARVEHLEAIVASEPWDALPTPTAAPVALPDEASDAPPEERPGRRHRSR